MAGIVRKVYKINIKLTNNDENEEKEFTINNISQILLQNFAELSNGLPDDLSEKNHIYMLKDNYYIDSEILKSIRATKGEKNKYEFKNFKTTGAEQIANEFYKPILRYTDNTIKIKILKEILKFAVDAIEYSKKLADNPSRAEQEERAEKIGLLNAKLRNIANLQPNDKAIDEFFDDILKILVEKNIMSYLKSIYENTNDRNLDEFRNNLSNIMLKINSDPEKNINLNKLETYRYFLDDKNIEAIF